MSIKAWALAAGIAVSSATGALAAPASPLNITFYSQQGGKLFTSINTTSGFLGALTAAFNTSGFDDLYTDLTSTYSGLSSLSTILISFRAPSGSGDKSWSGQLGVDTATKTMTFGGVTLLSPVELDIQGPVAVPGPEAGAGAGALLLGSLLLWRQRRRQMSTI